MASSGAAALIVPAVKKHTATVIMLHGLGDSGSGWIDLAQNFRRRQKFDEVSFIFPNAPMIPITVNMGMRMPGWYDIPSFDTLGASNHDESGILRSQSYIHSLIQQESTKHSIPSSRIVLGGFSQGAAMSIFSGLTFPGKLAGVFGLSGYLLLHEKIRGLVPDGDPNKGTEIFMGHGDMDPLVRYEWGTRTRDLLREWGYSVDFRTYEGLEHSADPKEIDDLEQYLERVLPPIADKN